MAINQIDAAGIINREYPGCYILKQILYNNFFVFLLELPDPDEFETFVKVDKATGDFMDFSPWNEPDPLGLEQAFLAQP